MESHQETRERESQKLESKSGGYREKKRKRDERESRIHHLHNRIRKLDDSNVDESDLRDRFE